jgi:proline/betaine transport protein TphA
MIGKQKNKVVLSGAFGNVLEWYDFTIYAFFVPIIATQFFPNKDPFISILATFGVFAVGFLVRPLGAVLFGFIGDHTGRKKALILSMVMMSCPTFLIGLLPNYDHLGMIAPLLLVGLRIIQGLAVSGELTTATVFLIEHADADRRGIAGSLPMAGASLGMALSSVFASVMTELLSQGELMAWGWRIPFVFGGLLGILGLVIRLRSADPSVYQEVTSSKNTLKQPVSVKSHISSLSYRTVLVGIFLTSIMAIANYFLIAFFNTFLVETQGLPLRQVMMINTCAIVVSMTMAITMGRLSDFFGRIRVLKAGVLGAFVLACPVFWLLSQQDIVLALLGELVFALVCGVLTGVVPTMLAELFDVYHRNMGMSISYNVSLSLFGGTAPLVAIALVKSTENFFSPAWYLMCFASIAFLALNSLNPNTNDSLLKSCM